MSIPPIRCIQTFVSVVDWFFIAGGHNGSARTWNYYTRLYDSVLSSNVGQHKRLLRLCDRIFEKG